MSLNESIAEDAALEWFGELGYAVGYGSQMAPGEPATEQNLLDEVVLAGRLRDAIQRQNPAIPSRALTPLRNTLLPNLLSMEMSVTTTNHQIT